MMLMQVNTEEVPWQKKSFTSCLWTELKGNKRSLQTLTGRLILGSVLQVLPENKGGV